MIKVEKNNSVKQMVAVLKHVGPMTENEITKAAFGYDRNTSFGSNKKYADMLRRGLAKGIIGRVEADIPGRAQYYYYATKEIEVPCSLEQDMEWANESENIQ